MFSVALHVVGRLVSVLIPSAVGPRQAGQLASSETLASRLRTHVRDRERRIVQDPRVILLKVQRFRRFDALNRFPGYAGSRSRYVI
jgi:hypothetical protein